MKILADTNILISALMYPHSVPSRALLNVADCHELVLSDYNIATTVSAKRPPPSLRSRRRTRDTYKVNAAKQSKVDVIAQDT